MSQEIFSSSKRAHILSDNAISTQKNIIPNSKF